MVYAARISKVPPTHPKTADEWGTRWVRLSDGGSGKRITDTDGSVQLVVREILGVQRGGTGNLGCLDD